MTADGFDFIGFLLKKTPPKKNKTQQQQQQQKPAGVQSHFYLFGIFTSFFQL